VTQIIVNSRSFADLAADIVDLKVTFTRPGQEAADALKGVTLTIGRGEIVGVIGESGSGKSVLARTMMGLTPRTRNVRTSGAAFVCGVDMAAGDERARRQTRKMHLGMIFQDPMSSLDPTMRIGRQVAEAAGSGARAVELLEIAGIPRAAERIRSYPHELSGGLRQRVMIAIALSEKPALIIADEPTTALDVTVQARLLQTLRSLCAETGTSMMFITHDLAVASAVVDRMIVMRQGLIVESGSTAQILHRPDHTYTRGLIASRVSLTSDRTRPLPVVEYDATADQTDHIVEPVAPWAPVRPASTDVVVVQGVTKTYRARGRAPLNALDDVSFSIACGESVAIVGESGSGKTTLLRMISGLESPTSGTITAARDLSPQIVFQDSGSSLTPWLTVGSLLRERLTASRFSRAQADDRVEEVLGYVGLKSDLLDRKPGQLSGGQKQRIALARAIIATPKLLLCDEPTSALDATRAAAVLNQIGQIRRRFDMSILFITHDIAAARVVSDRIVVMQKGRIVEQGSAEQITTNPREEYTRRLIAAVPEMMNAPAGEDS
jgi:peptide/nickel transport system ATP-binding protein